MAQTGTNEELEVREAVAEHRAAIDFVRDLVANRLVRAGWITGPVFFDHQGMHKLDWTPIGIEKARQVRALLIDLQFIDGRVESHRGGEFDVLVELLGDCVAIHGPGDSTEPEAPLGR
jgi:hypothetical protein